MLEMKSLYFKCWVTFTMECYNDRQNQQIIVANKMFEHFIGNCIENLVSDYHDYLTSYSLAGSVERPRGGAHRHGVANKVLSVLP